MIENGVHIGWEHTLIGIVHLDGRIRPPEECLGQVCAVRYASLDFEIGTTRAQGETCHAFLVEHALHLVDPYRHRTVFIVNNGAIDRHKSAGTMVLGPVELNATTDPRSG